MKIVLALLLMLLSLGADASDKVTIQMRTAVDLVLMHHVSSGISRPGSKIWFKVAADVEVDGSVVIAKGTIAEGRIAGSNSPGNLGRGGSLALDVRVVTAVDGSKIPLEGFVELTGDDRSLFWNGWHAKGKAAFAERGSRLTADVAADRAVSLAAPEPDVEEIAEPKVLEAKSRPKTYWLKPKAGTAPKPLVVTVATSMADPIESMAIVKIGDRALPGPIHPVKAYWRQAKGKTQRELEFHGWEVIRFFDGRFDENETLTLVGETKLGQPVTSIIEIAVRPRS